MAYNLEMHDYISSCKFAQALTMIEVNHHRTLRLLTASIKYVHQLCHGVVYKRRTVEYSKSEKAERKWLARNSEGSTNQGTFERGRL